MNHKPFTFWGHVDDLRERGLISLEWKSRDLKEHLQEPVGPYKPNTINSLPLNYSISLEGDGIGDSIMKGGAPKAWRLGPGQFRLIADPKDDEQTQEENKENAERHAEKLRARKMKANSQPLPDPPNRPSLKAESVPGSPDLYPSISITLTSELCRYLAGLRTTEKKAEAIVLLHLIDKYRGRAEIEEDQEGADLRVSIDGKTERIEVKGTEKSTIAWQQLKVSSQKSHDALKNGGVSVYRVVDVDSENPRIYILTYGQHFTLEPEPRWAARPVPPKDERYPLRGEPYRYDLHNGPVAVDEWEAME